jgi:hypothetical protein
MQVAPEGRMQGEPEGRMEEKEEGVEEEEEEGTGEAGEGRARKRGRRLSWAALRWRRREEEAEAGVMRQHTQMWQVHSLLALLVQKYKH